MIEELYWPEEEVTRFVRGGKRMFSIHNLSELKRLKAPYRVLYGNRAEIAAELAYEPLPWRNGPRRFAQGLICTC